VPQVDPELTGSSLGVRRWPPAFRHPGLKFAGVHWRSRRPRTDVHWCAGGLLRTTTRSRSRLAVGERETHGAPRRMACSKARRSRKTGGRFSSSARLSATVNPAYAALPVIVTSSS